MGWLRNRLREPVLSVLFLASVGLVLVVPAVGLVANLSRMPDPLAEIVPEGGGLKALAWLPRALDRLVASRFGLRDEMIHFDSQIKAALGGESRRVAYGTDGFLFLKDDDVFSQATGQRLDRERLRRFADLAQSLARQAAADGRRFAVLVAPNKHTVYRRFLPVWARAQPALTEREVAVAMLRQRGVTVVDPADALIARAATEPVYWRGDTHWTPYGRIVAFDALVEALGLPGQAIGVDSVFRGARAVDRAGDLVRIAGLGDSWPDLAPRAVGPDPFLMPGLMREKADPRDPFGTYRVRRETPPARPGPRVMVIGDSFSAEGFDALFMRFAGEYQWTHHRAGRFDRALIRSFDPDILVLETVERQLVSLEGGAAE